MDKQPAGKIAVPGTEFLPYPSSPVFRRLFKMPLLLWRLGLGPLLGHLFIIVTTTGRRSGRVRHTPLEYHVHKGRTYVMAAWPRSDWYQNLLRDPHVTLQAANGVQHMLARRVTDDDELTEAYGFIKENPVMRGIWQAIGFSLSREDFVAQKDQFHLVTFDPTGEPTPPPLQADLKWVWGLVAVSGLLGWAVRRRAALRDIGERVRLAAG